MESELSLKTGSSAIDRFLALLIFAASVAYLISMPRTLSWSDESYFLYEAKRVAEGEVMYRDIFQFVTPGASYIMALSFLLFGANIVTAKVASAIVHGIVATLLFAMCRRLAVRRAMAATAALAYLALSEVAWPHASWHWFSTAALVLQGWTLLSASWPRPPRWALLPGIVSGVALGVQHQRGLLLAAGVAVLFVFEHVIARLSGDREKWLMLFLRLAAYVAGILLVVIPLLAPSVWLAGVDALIDAWVRFPLENYRTTYGSSWGEIGPFSTPLIEQTSPAVLRSLPIIAVALATLHLIAGIEAGQGRKANWPSSVLLLLSISAVASVWYNPDFIHLAFVAPIFLLPVAQTAEFAWRIIQPPSRAISLLLTVATIVVAVGLGAQLYRNLVTAWDRYPFAHETAFGRIDSATSWEGAFIDTIRKQLDEVGSREMFCYPHMAGPYLTAGGRNPTPYQFADAQVLARRHTERIVRILWERHVPTMVMLYGFVKYNDPVRELVRLQYRAVPIPELRTMGVLPPVFLYRYQPDVTLPAPPEFGVEMF